MWKKEINITLGRGETMLKRFLFLIVLLPLVFASGCNSSGEQNSKKVNYDKLNKSHIAVYKNNDVVMTLDKKTYFQSIKNTKFSIVNNSNKTFMGNTAGYILELYRNNYWLTFPFIDNLSITDVEFKLKPRVVFHQVINFQNLKYPLVKGKYRVIKKMSEVNKGNPKTIYVATEFEIK